MTVTTKPDEWKSVWFKPCPFCNCSDIRHEVCIVDSTVWCSCCGIKSVSSNLEHLGGEHGLLVATENWNRRNNDPAI